MIEMAFQISVKLMDYLIIMLGEMSINFEKTQLDLYLTQSSKNKIQTEYRSKQRQNIFSIRRKYRRIFYAHEPS